MAEIESKLKITASATGMKAIAKDADKLSLAFQRLGEAGETMGKKVAAGIAAQDAALKKSGTFLSRMLGRNPALGGGYGPGGGGGRGGGGGSARPRRPRPPGSPDSAAAAIPKLPSELGISAGMPGAVGAGGPAGAPPSSGGGGGGGGGGAGGSGPKKDRRGFGRGFSMGSLGIDYLDYADQPANARRQAAGIMAGRLARRTVGSAIDVFGASTQGAGAVAGAVTGIPLVGGILGASVLHNLQAAQGEIQAQAGFSALMPYIRGGQGRFTDRMDAQRRRLTDMGMRFGGLSANQSLGMFASAAAQSGGTLAGFGDERLQRALQAQQGYGVDMGTSLRLMRGEDLGQSTGRNSANTLGQALGNARGLGLEGAEVTQYLRAIAQGMEEVNATGIKFSASGQGDLERVMQRTMGAGVAGTRVEALGRGVESGMSSLAQRGPQNANQAFMLEAAGFDPERPQTYARAMRALEDPTKRAGIFSRAQKLVLRSGQGFDRDTQAEMVRSFLQDNNASISHTEARNIIDAGGINAQQARLAENLSRSSVVGDQELAQQAQSNTPLSAQRTAYMGSLDTRMGMGATGSVMELDATAKQMQSQIQGLGQQTLRLVSGLSEVAKTMSGFVFGPSTQGASTQTMR